MNETTLRRAIVTGASSGIGAATVRELRAQGWQVVAAARRLDKLEALAAETGAEALALDVTSDESVAAFRDAVLAGGPVHSVVNNAGGAIGLEPVESGKVEDWSWMYDVNVLGALRVTQAFLPALREAGGGDLVFVTSIAAYLTYEGGAGYTAAKHAERMIANTLRLELSGEPIRIIEIAPGAVATDEFSLVRFAGDAERAAAVYQGYQPLVAEDVAEAIVWTLSRPSHVNIDTLQLRPVAQAAPHKVAKTLR
jgi:NADP-dependent 3-hydroxy acid dehydrogenase YdfG